MTSAGEYLLSLVSRFIVSVGNLFLVGGFAIDRSLETLVAGSFLCFAFLFGLDGTRYYTGEDPSIMAWGLNGLGGPRLTVAQAQIAWVSWRDP